MTGDATKQGTGGPVMLALSTFRRSDAAAELAIQKAAERGRLVIVYVADQNLARYFMGSDVGVYPELKDKCEADLLKEHERAGREHVEGIAARARERGLDVSTSVSIGRFGPVCMGVVECERPSLIVTTRSKRPNWVRRFFGSPVDYLIERCGCPVVEA